MLPEVNFIFPERDQKHRGLLVIALGRADWDQGVNAPARYSARIEYLRQSGIFKAKEGQLLFLPPDGIDDEGMILVGLGDNTDASAWRGAGAAATAELLQRGIAGLVFDLAFTEDSCAVDQLEWLVEGTLQALYRYDKYRGNADSEALRSFDVGVLVLNHAQLDMVKSRMERRLLIAQGVALARDLVNEPSNVKNPEFLAATAWEQGRDAGIKTTVIGRKALEDKGFGALLGVAQGSACEPRLIVMEYNGTAADQAPVALVGKAVTFDSGGISLKPGENMDQMKMDMAGGAVVMATLISAARLKLPLNLVGVIPAVENMPSGTAQRPGDIVRSLSGKTIEVLNTDAEGRLILADALHWVGGFKPRVVIDLATLTGACIIALGHHAAAVLGNDTDLAEALLAAGERSGERLWRLPLFKEYAKQLESSMADLKNIGGRPAGTITAAAFLQHFAPDCPWAHIDIAGVAWAEKSSAGQPVGGTGFGVRMLLEYLSGME